MFRAAVESGEFATIGDLFAEDAVLHSPISHRPYHGQDMIAAIICAVANTLNDFRFDKEMRGEHGGDHALMSTPPWTGCRSKAAISCTRGRTA